MVALYGCEYRGGRAESAPKLRTQASTKFTMADSELQAMEESSELPFNPRMPHLELSRKALDEHFPSIEAVQEDIMLDLDGGIDPMLVHGQKLADDIQHDMDVRGRTRHFRERDGIVYVQAGKLCLATEDSGA